MASPPPPVTVPHPLPFLTTQHATVNITSSPSGGRYQLFDLTQLLDFSSVPVTWQVVTASSPHSSLLYHQQVTFSLKLHNNFVLVRNWQPPKSFRTSFASLKCSVLEPTTEFEWPAQTVLNKMCLFIKTNNKKIQTNWFGAYVSLQTTQSLSCLYQNYQYK